jgi:hypothetical protein
VWYKDGRFVEGLHAVGDILTKISVNCVINLHAALLFTCLFLWVYPMCGYNCLYIYVYFLYMMHPYVYFYFNANLCIYRCICLFTFFIYISARVLCVYILIACISKNLCGIAQLDAGYVRTCSVERKKKFSRVSWLNLSGQGRYKKTVMEPSEKVQRP